MTSHIETCPDQHHCENGSKCVENPYKEKSYYCDCDEVIFDVNYEGLFCEHRAEVYCTDRADVTIQEHWFCTNGGVCSTEPSSGKLGCSCPDEYEGTYCQFAKGTKPEGYPFTSNKVSTMSNSGPIIGAVVGSLVTLLVMSVVGAAIVFRHRNVKKNLRTTVVSDPSLELEADGSVLKDSMASPTSVANTQIHTEQMEMASHRRISPPLRPGTAQSEAGLSYCEEGDDDDNSMMSFT